MSELPPYARTLGLTEEPQDDGPPLLVMPFADPVLGRPGFLHGGAIAGLLEFAAFGALRRELAGTASEAGDVRMKPIGVTVDFLRGGTGVDTRAAGAVKRMGKRVAHVEAWAWQEDESRPIATARMNVMLGRP